MNNSVITINDFFGLKKKKLSKKLSSAIESSTKIVNAQENVLKEIAGIKWPVALKEIVQRIDEILSVSIVDIMVRAWDKSRILIKYLDKKKYGNETILVPLAEHTIKSTHHPYIELLINDKSVGKLNFNINLSIMLKGIILKIQNGKITEIMIGSCQGNGNIKCEGFLLAEKKLKSIKLPYAINFADGVAITASRHKMPK
jgi:hypothetical protein